MGFLLNRESGASYALQVVRQAAAQLFAGRLHPGDRLPSVRRLARQLGISRSTAERIQEALCDSMLAEVRPRSGIYVARDLDPIEVQESLHAVYEFLKETVERAERLGLDRARLLKLLGDLSEPSNGRQCPLFPVVATRDFYECVRASLTNGFPARICHLPPDGSSLRIPQKAHYILTSYYMRPQAEKIAEALGCSLLYMRFNEKLLDKAMSIPADQHRHFVTRDADNAECTKVFLANAYPEVPTDRYTVAPAATWLENVNETRRTDQVWTHLTAFPLVRNRVDPARIRLFHPVLDERFLDELRCLALLSEVTPSRNCGDAFKNSAERSVETNAKAQRDGS